MSSGGYGQVSGDQRQSQGKKRMALAGMSAVLLVAMVVGVAVTVNRGRGGSSSESGNSGEMSESVKAIDTICQPTDYKEACVNTLTKATGANVTDPSELIKIAFNVAVEKVEEVFNHSAVLEAAEKDPRAAFALRNCEELLQYSVNDLQNSVEQMTPFDPSKLNKLLEDLKVWLSAAITYEETCLDGFENTTSQAGADMRKAMNLSMELTQNTLAIVDDVANLLTAFKVPSFSRRLLSEEGDQEETPLSDDGFPQWVDERRRQLLAGDVKPNVVVATDGSGDYRTINDALSAVPPKHDSPFVIYIKAGVYKEIVQVNRSLTNLMMVGDGPTKTKITGNLNFIDGTPTFKTATFAVIGDGFIAKDMGFENTAGAEKHQAVALRVQSDMSIFYNCQMDGYQDTLYTHTKRQFYRDCTISGTIDFIFGNAPVVFQNCLMLVRKPMANQQNIVTAQGRKDRREPTAIILHNCTISADDGFPRADWTANPSYLGRPWKEYSRTFILQTQINDVINPQGWLPWFGDFGLNTCFYTEVDNRGPGAKTDQRATWRGVKKIDYSHALQFTVASFIQGDRWIKPTGIPYIPGLLPEGSASP